MSKTTLLLKQMTEETDLCRNEHSGITMVAMEQNVETYPTTQCKCLLILKMGGSYSSVPLGCNVLNNAKPFSVMVY